MMAKVREDPATLFKLGTQEEDSLEDALLRQERSSIPPINRIIFIGQTLPCPEEHQTLQPVFDLLGVDGLVPVECNPLFPVLGTLVEAAILRRQGTNFLECSANGVIESPEVVPSNLILSF